ncbi:MAG: hypothetical protein AAB834_05705 [Patescibacteria group bacterium]
MLDKRHTPEHGQSGAIAGSLAERVLDTGDPNDVNGSLVAAYRALTGETINPWRLRWQTRRSAAALIRFAECDNPEKPDHAVYKIDPGRIERTVASAALLDIFKDRKVGPGTVLSSWPLYEHLYRRHGHNGGTAEIDPATDNALLIGSLSALSSRAFSAMAEDVFATRRAYVVDVRSGQDKRRPEHGTFVYGNGLKLPFANGTMRIVQTNQLLHMIIDADGAVIDDLSEQAMTHTLLGEMFRVLAPGGQVLMREVAPGLDEKDKGWQSERSQARLKEFEVDMRAGLEATGFTDISIEPAWDMESLDYLFDPERQFKIYPTVESPRGFGIYARKALT